MIATLFELMEGAAPAVPFVVIEVPGDPEGKKAHESRYVPKSARTGRGGFIHNYLPAQTVKYQERIAGYARKAMIGKAMIGPGEAFAMRLFIMMPIPQSWPRWKRDAALAGTIYPTGKPDDDNVSKALDALNGIVWHDDSQRVHSLLWKEYGENPGLIIECYRLP